jgi:biopolymer transport protein ExbD
MAVKQVQTQEGINPQIIPMIDIMFLLLLFFMLGADMGHREFEDVRLPTADGVVAEGTEQARPITVNCYHLQPNDAPCRVYEGGGVCVQDAHWRIGIRGFDYKPAELPGALEPYAAGKRAGSPTELRSEQSVQIRADASALYGLVQAVMNACAQVGIYKVEIGAAATK